MAKINGAVTVNTERCKDLKKNEVNNRGYHYAYMAEPEKCIGCSSCALVCPDACIEVYRVVEK